MFRLVLILLVLLAAAAPGVRPAAADDRSVCFDETSAPDVAIGTCGRLIASGKLSGLELARAYNFRARGHERRGEFDRATPDYNEAIRLSPHAALYVNRAVNYSSKRDFDRALADANQALKLDAKYARAYGIRGFALAQKGDDDRAFADYNEAIRLDPTYASGYHNRALIYQKRNDYGRAIADLSGQAGLAMSYYLGQLGREHIVLERRRVAERWRSERWDSLCFQAPNWNMRLPGFAHHMADPDAFAPRDDVVRYIEGYACAIRAPLRCGVAATALRQKPGSADLVIETPVECFEAKNVVIATGPFQMPAAPPIRCREALQLHSSQYRNPELLPPGAVLIVGSGNSGCQIAEELCSGRRVYLSVSSHQRTPRRYRGKDCIWWNLALGDADRTVDQRVDAQSSRLMTGVGGGHDVDLRRLAAAGVVLLGRVLGGRDGRLVLAPDLGENLARGDASLIALTRRCDQHVVQNGLDFPAPDPCTEILPDPNEVTDPILTLDVAAAGISTIIWANGFRYDFSWIDLPIFGHCCEASNLVPSHKRGITCVPGVYFLGLPWLHKWKSAFLFGVGEDAEHLATQIAKDSQPRCAFRLSPRAKSRCRGIIPR